ncbi:MAG: hypothetical protein GY932_06940 [Arcobacter sp.]|nr:hypothetical protein [Arcobacter sp.]
MGYDYSYDNRSSSDVDNSKHIFKELIDKTDPKKERGSIPYLLIESHSTSRRVLHDEVKDFLKRLGPKR